MEPGKKISFGFNKTSKKPLTIGKPLEKKVDYVVSLEGQSVKLKDEPKQVEKTPLVIPLKDNQKNLLDRVRDMKVKHKTNSKNESVEDTRPDSELTIEELAAREVVRDAKQRLAQNDTTTTNKTFVVPIKKEDDPPLGGEKESTLADYENIPVSDFGLAMLRGMGWKEGVGIGKNQTKSAAVKAPELRPKGLGLGASTLVKSETPKQPPTDGEGQTLVLKKGCYAKIIAGNNKGNYCEVQGLDDEAGRVVVKTAIKSEILSLNEFLLVPVTKEEYSKNSKVINSIKYEEYKEMEQRKIKTEIKTENSKTISVDTYKEKNSKIKKEKESDDEKRYYSIAKVKPEKTNNSSSDEKYSKGSSSKSRDKEKSSRHSRKYKDSSDSDSDYGKSRRVHKRKDKRRHRDKSRSPCNRSKHKSSKKSSKSKQRYSSSSDSDYDSRSKSRNGKSSSSDSDYDRFKRRNKR